MTKLYPAFETLEFYAGLTTGALIAETVKITAKKAIERITGSD